MGIVATVVVVLVRSAVVVVVVVLTTGRRALAQAGVAAMPATATATQALNNALAALAATELLAMTLLPTTGRSLLEVSHLGSFVIKCSPSFRQSYV
jgi:hypothetical protein